MPYYNQLYKSISIHTLHTEGDTQEEKIKAYNAIFQSTPSTRRVTLLYLLTTANAGFQSTPSTRRVTVLICTNLTILYISIHTLHTEGDKIFPQMDDICVGISIHTLHTEGDSKYKQLYHICTSINCTIYPII